MNLVMNIGFLSAWCAHCVKGVHVEAGIGALALTYKAVEEWNALYCQWVIYQHEIDIIC